MEREKRPGIPEYRLTGEDIKKLRQSLDQNFIVAPYNEGNAKGCGYNLTSTEFVFSVRKQRMLSVHKTRQGTTYVELYPNDTALFITREYIKLGGKLAGAIYSRVQMVSQGLGHISTTLDAGWKGMLLIAINNPLKRKVRLELSSSPDGQTTYTGIATMVLDPVSSDGNIEVMLSLDNPPMRLDVLKRLAAQPKRIIFDSKYQKFRKLISDLENFQPEQTPYGNRVAEIRKALIDAEKSLKENNSIDAIARYIVELKRANYEDLESLKAKTIELQKAYSTDEQDEESVCKLAGLIDLAIRECDYLLLSEHISQIHELISKGVPHVWPRHTIKQFLGFIAEHWRVWAAYASVSGLAALICSQLGVLSGTGAVIVPATASILAPFISFFLDRSHM